MLSLGLAGSDESPEIFDGAVIPSEIGVRFGIHLSKLHSPSNTRLTIHIAHDQLGLLGVVENKRNRDPAY